MILLEYSRITQKVWKLTEQLEDSSGKNVKNIYKQPPEIKGVVKL